MQTNADQFYESLQGLLPQGFAWPRHPDSTWMRLLRSEAAELAQHTEDAHAMVRQWQGHRERVAWPLCARRWQHAQGHLRLQALAH